MNFISFNTRKALAELGMAEDEQYMSRETRERKIKIIEESVVEAILKNKNLGKDLDVKDMSMKKMAQDITSAIQAILS